MNQWYALLHEGPLHFSGSIALQRGYFAAGIPIGLQPYIDMAHM